MPAKVSIQPDVGGGGHEPPVKKKKGTLFFLQPPLRSLFFTLYFPPALACLSHSFALFFVAIGILTCLGHYIQKHLGRENAEVP